MRKQKSESYVEKSIRARNLFYAIKLNLFTGTREERLRAIEKCQAQGNVQRRFINS